MRLMAISFSDRGKVCSIIMELSKFDLWREGWGQAPQT